MEDLTQEFLAESREGLEQMELRLTELEQRPGDQELLDEIFRSMHTIKGSSGFLNFERLGKLAHAGESLLAALRDGKLTVSEQLISGLLELRDGLLEILRLIETTGGEGQRSTDDDAELIARLMELLAGGGSVAKARPQAVEMAVQADARAAAERAGANGNGAGGSDKSLRIDVAVLNQMMNLVGELVLTRNQMLQCTPASKCFPELTRRLNAVTTELRESVMQARMQPVGHVFAKYPRMVRDLARTCGKRVRIEFEGQETGLDKGLLEAVRDPLTHAVRNAVDHGIEPEAERVRAGKPAEGLVRLRAFQQNGTVVIEVSDDGAGIATGRLLAKAVERGLVTPERASHMDEREALQLVFLPGVSTAKEVSSVSGRGVGMDVVRTNVEQAGGRVELESRAGAGTTLRMRIPLTLAILPALVVESAGESFAVPQSALVELVFVPHAEAGVSIERLGGAELYRLRESLLPLVRLDRLLQIEMEEPAGKGLYIAVLESDGRRFGLVVDGLKEPEEIVVKPLSATLRELGVYSGATVLGNGRLAMILDLATIAARAGVRESSDQMRAAAKAHAEQEKSAMAELEVTDAVVLYEASRRGADGTLHDERMAMPLSAVEYIATVPVSKIEYAGGRTVVQYLGELLALEDEGGMLAALRGSARASVTVLICLRGAERNRVGVVTRRVLDVCAAEKVRTDESLAVVGGRVAALHPGLTARAAVEADAVRVMA